MQPHVQRQFARPPSGDSRPRHAAGRTEPTPRPTGPTLRHPRPVTTPLQRAPRARHDPTCDRPADRVEARTHDTYGSGTALSPTSEGRQADRGCEPPTGEELNAFADRIGLPGWWSTPRVLSILGFVVLPFFNPLSTVLGIIGYRKAKRRKLPLRLH